MELKREIHTRFKYAEERAKRLDDAGRLTWNLHREPDVQIEEDGVIYNTPQYVVEWAE